MAQFERLVCHSCGFKLPVGAVTSADVFDCCPRPCPRIHDVRTPCEWCTDEPVRPMATQVAQAVR